MMEKFRIMKKFYQKKRKIKYAQKLIPNNLIDKAEIYDKFKQGFSRKYLFNTYNIK